MKESIVLQRILLDGNPIYDESLKMYYRTKGMLPKAADGGYFLKENKVFNFSTYFNSFSLEKWKTYTYIENVALEIRAKGRFGISLLGYSIDSCGKVKKEWLRTQYYDLKEEQTLYLPYPENISSKVVSFRVEAYQDTEIYEANYRAPVDMEQKGQPRIVLVTTTFRKENYILKNIRTLNRELFQNPEYRQYFSWKIIDNGQTLNAREINNEYIEVIPNKNVGGSGGFARGMIAACEQEEKATHVLLMDDDVEIIPESFKRLCTLLMFMRPEYRGHFISGAMLEISRHNIQHEDVGYFNPLGGHGPVKPRYDLNCLKNIVKNEEFLPEDPHQYSGWWFCCIPMTVVRKDNLPFPLFVRGDDVEYSIRNHARFITMNGICIWHEGFGSKFSGALELYQVHRNDLILQAMHSEVGDVKVMQRITWLFWEELYKFNYKGADLLLDAVEDYLKGPEFISNLNGELCMKEKKAKDNRLMEIPEEIRNKISYEDLYEYKDLGKMKKKIYDYTLNGQRFEKFFSRRRTGVIPYGWGYYPEKQFLTDTNYAIDPVNGLCVVYEKSVPQLKRLKARFQKVMAEYDRKNEAVSQAYKKYEKEGKSIGFWKDYLK